MNQRTRTRNLALSLVLLPATLTHTGLAQALNSMPDALVKNFQTPPASAKLRCYWWWLNGHTTKETITRDLTEMQHKGYGGVLLVDANGSNQTGNDNVPAGPEFASPGWTELYLHALKTADALGLEITLNITSGWNPGPLASTPSSTPVTTPSRSTSPTSGLTVSSAMPSRPPKNTTPGPTSATTKKTRHC
jgi:hypothetical protein